MKTLNKIIFASSLALAMPMAMMAADEVPAPVAETEATSEFGSEEPLEEGFVTSYINAAIASSMPAATAPANGEVKYGYKLTDYVSAPKFGGYIIGKYAYSDEEGKHDGDGFSARLIRVYVDGTVLKHFKYRIQMELNGSPHVKDFTLEWAKFKEFSVKIGQFKRCFGFENPYNPWDVGVGDYSQLTKKLAGMGDYCGEPSMGGRDQGIQLAGDLVPVGADKHRLFHYQVAIYNGQGINSKDANSRKDVIGTFQVQPVKDLFLGVFGWSGTYTNGGVTVNRKRYALGAKYEHNNWSARAEYAHNTGHKISDVDATTGEVKGTGRADAWYITAGVPVCDWFKVFVKYDAYRDQGNGDNVKSIYSICPNIRLHKNLMFQVQYNYVNQKLASDNKGHNELWLETFVRF